MDVFIREFPKQLKQAIAIGEEAKLSKHNKPIQNIIVLGMGGSGIGGNFAASFTIKQSRVPILSCKGYQLPAFVNENSLVVASSYSGNTEETLNTFEEAVKKGSKIVCITSGGKLLARAEDLGLDYIQLPKTGQPPRACLGYSFVQQLFILRYFGFAPKDCIDQVKKGITTLEQNQAVIRKQATKMAKQLYEKYPMIYSTTRMEPVALRFRQQLNENAKMLCNHHIFPEMNHNELVGWREQTGNFAAVIFRSADNLQRNQLRIDTSKEIISKYAEIFEIDCLGDSLIEQSLYGVHFGDWISMEMSNLRQVDPVEVDAIDYLKGKLSEAKIETSS